MAHRSTATRTRRSSTAGSSGSSTATPRRTPTPYARGTTLGDATADSVTTADRQLVAAQRARQVNYIRNSVKATVDAYDGTVTLYAWDDEDPSSDLDEGVPGHRSSRARRSRRAAGAPALPRGPVQGAARAAREVPRHRRRGLLRRPGLLEVPDDPTQRPATGATQPPYYLSLQMPDQTRADVLADHGVRAERAAEHWPRSWRWTPRHGDDYGTIRVLQLPSNTTIHGPGQVQNTFESDPDVAQRDLLACGSAARSTLGNLLTLPVGGGLLYVAAGLRAGGDGHLVPAAAAGDRGLRWPIAIAETLQAALDKVFEGDSGAETEEPDKTPGRTHDTTPVPGPRALSSPMRSRTRRRPTPTARPLSRRTTSPSTASSRTSWRRRSTGPPTSRPARARAAEVAARRRPRRLARRPRRCRATPPEGTPPAGDT